MSRSILGLANKEARPNLHYDLVDPSTGQEYPCPTNTGWRYNRETMGKKISEGCILFPAKKTGRPREKVFLAGLQTSSTGFPSIIDGIYTADGTASLRSIFGEQPFAFPKPPELVQVLINQATDKDSLILDSFAGSGTTAHAVLAQNATDGGNRRFILVEMDENICQNVTAQRITKAIEGYGEGKNAVPGLGGGFRYCKLGSQMFDRFGGISSEVRFADLAAHVFFTETGSPLPKKNGGKTPFWGVYQGRAVYLLYNGILGDKRPDGGNVLTHEVAQDLPPHVGLRVVYGEACRLGKKSLESYNITFKQVPFELKVD